MSFGNRNTAALRWSILLGGLLLGLAACLSEIKLEVPGEKIASIAIRGQLIGGEHPLISIKITSLSEFNASSVARPVSEASVVLIDEFNNGIDVPLRRPGLYELEIPAGAFPLEVRAGQAYQLSVSTPGGKNYLSTFELLSAVPEPEELRYLSTRREVLNEVNNVIDREFIQFLLTTPIVSPQNGAPSFLKWDFIGTYKFPESTLASAFPPNTRTCYITERLNLENVVVFDGSQSGQDLLRDLVLLEEPFDFRFSNGFYLTIRQQSLSEGAFRYWEQIGKVVQLSGNFFETPPGKVSGNFFNPDDLEEEIFGYFYATEEAILRLYVDPGNDPPMPFCPLTAVTATSVDTTCLECLLRAGSTLEKPAFWEE